MKSKLVLGLFLLLTMRVQAQTEGTTDNSGALDESNQESVINNIEPSKLSKPKSRLKQRKDGQPSESSSFMGDSDNLDPLNPNRDNLKDDSEPVLEDIKDVLNTDTRKQKEEAQKQAEEKAKAEAEAAAAAATPPPPAPEEPPAPQIMETTPPPVAAPSVSPDEPDLALEREFHDIYRRYNINPTPDDIWAAVSAQQTARLYQVQKGDTLWSISKILFGDPNFWPKLWSLNKQGILNPHFINPDMKVYFFEGDEENAPTLAVGELPAELTPEVTPQVEPEIIPEPTPLATPAAPPAEGGAVAAAPPVVVTEVIDNPELAKLNELSKEAAPKIGRDGNIYATRNPEIQEADKKPRSKYKRPIKIPDSFKVLLNESYYGLNKKKEAEVRIDLGTPPKSELFYNNDIILTDLPVASEVKILISETQKMRCTAGRLLKEIEFSGDLLNEYEIYDPIETLDTSTGLKYGYRYVGDAKVYQGKYLKVQSCNSILKTDLVVMPKNKFKELATTKISDEADAQIIGGPDLKGQKFFSTSYYAYIDFGSNEYNVGQAYKTISDLTDKVNGEFVVIEKYGSYGVVLFTNIRDTITFGDRVLIQ